MHKILSPLKYILARKLQNTQWRCDPSSEATAEFYQLNFIDSSKVKGYSKSFDEVEAQLMFNANFFFKSKTIIQFFNADESFTAHLDD